MKKLLQSLILAGVVAAPAALADNHTSPHTVTGNVGFSSDYRFRGISQTFEEPALMGGFDYAHSSGLYLGTWASNVDSSFLAGSNMEWDIYGGYTFTPIQDVTVNVGGLYYYYPGKDEAAFGFDPNTFEVYAGATWKWLNVKYSHSTTKLFGIADSKGSGYLEANLSFALPYDITLGAHVAKQYVDGTGNEDYTDWKLSVGKTILGFNVSLAYVDTDIDAGNATWGYTTAYTLGSDTKNLADGIAVLYVGKTF